MSFCLGPLISEHELMCIPTFRKLKLCGFSIHFSFRKWWNLALLSMPYKVTTATTTSPSKESLCCKSQFVPPSGQFSPQSDLTFDVRSSRYDWQHQTNMAAPLFTSSLAWRMIESISHETTSGISQNFCCGPMGPGAACSTFSPRPQTTSPSNTGLWGKRHVDCGPRSSHRLGLLVALFDCLPLLSTSDSTFPNAYCLSIDVGPERYIPVILEGVETWQ